MPSLKLGHQGSLIVLLLLVIECGFIYQYFRLLDQAEIESRYQQRTKETITRASGLLEQIYTAGDSIGKFALHHTADEEKRYLDAVKEIPLSVAFLKEELKNDPEQMERLGRIEENVNFGLDILSQMKRKADADPHYVIYFVQWVELQPRLAALVRDLKGMLRSERQRVDLIPQAARQQREKTKNILMVGGTLNVAVALLLALFFVWRLRARLNVVVDNSRRLREGKQLQTPLSGRDEIAAVDASFHHMVQSLRGEEELLRASETQMRSMIESIPIGLMLLDGGGSVEFANTASERILSYPQGDLIARPLASVFSGDGTERGSDWINQIAPQQVVELQGAKGDGSTAYVELSTVDASVGEAKRRLAMMVDVSERYQMQKMRRAFVAMVSHELRTPLTSVNMYLEALEMELFGKTTPALAKEVTRNQTNVNQLIMLITDLLDLEKTEADKMPLSPSECVVEDVVDKSVEDIGKLLEEKNVRLHFEGSEIAIFVDRPKLTKALSNLLAGVTRLSAEGSLLEVTAVSETDKSTSIIVMSRSLDMTPSQLDNLFERFQQVEIDGVKCSLGLGLALCRAIIHRHGGTASATAMDSGGTCFAVRLPPSRS